MKYVLWALAIVFASSGAGTQAADTVVDDKYLSTDGDG